MEFGDILKQLRKQRGLSQDELAALLGTTTPEMAVQNAAAANWELTQEELDLINAKYAEYMA